MLALPLGGFLLGACSNPDIDLSQVDESRYEASSTPVAYLESKYGTTDIDSVIFNNEGKTAFIVKSSVAGKPAGQATLGYDAAVLEQYNKEFQGLYEQVITNENMKAYEEARQAVDEMMNYLTGILALCVNGEDPETCDPHAHAHDHECGGECSSCGGCH